MADNQQRREALRGKPLGDRELQVLRLTANGYADAEIGRELWIAGDTVKTAQRRLRAKLGATDRAHAVALGFARGLLTADDLRQAA